MRKQKLKSIIALVIIFLISIRTISVKAASASISCPSTATVNQAITISASGSGVQWNLAIKVNGTTIATSAELDNIDGNKPISFSGSYTPTSAGTLTVTLEGTVTEASDGSTIRSFGSKTITVSEPTPEPDPEPDPEPPENTTPGGGSSTNTNTNTNTDNNKPNIEKVKSGENRLSSLTVNVGKLSPAFSSDHNGYEIVFDEGFDFKKLTKIEFTAKAKDSKAKVNLPSDLSVRDGSNVYNIVVEAEDGTEKTYTIKLNKPEELTVSDLKLNSLEVDQKNDKGILSRLEYTPTFDPKVQNYFAEVGEDIESIEVYAKANDGIKVEIQGGDSLTGGDNEIYINLTSETDETIATVYKLTVTKPEVEETDTTTIGEIETNKKSFSKYIPYIVIGIIAVLAIVLIILMVVNHKMKKASGELDDDDDYDDDDDEDQLKRDKKKFEEAVAGSVGAKLGDEPKEEKIEDYEETEEEDDEEDDDDDDDYDDDDDDEDDNKKRKGGRRFQD